MSKFPNMWRDNDEFSIARRAKFSDQLMRSVEEMKKSRPEPKDQESIGRTTAKLELGQVINFVDQIAKHRGEEAKHSMSMRKMKHWYFRNRRLMQEAADKRKSEERKITKPE